MAYVEEIMKKNFVEFASYVIKERSIPHIDDGCKPVQRRVLHSLLSVDDGKFHKVANIIGNSMKYHPHGDAPIYDALVNLANKELFIDKQGNFGNIHTGDTASAARYIECRISMLGKELLYNPEITKYIPTYDGRNKEPVTFPSKLPLILMMGADGIAVVLATTILSHNFCEVIQALIATLKGGSFELFPDFLCGGYVDISEYDDGRGKVKVRAKLDVTDSKKIVITEVPFGVTTEQLMASIERAARKGSISISGIDDYTRHKVEIVINLPRGVYSRDVVDSLYAFTDCERSVSVNPIVIVKDKPEIMSITEIMHYYKERTLLLLKAELKVEEKKLLDKIHARTLERIFIEERIYKRIEKSKTTKSVFSEVQTGLSEFQREIKGDVTEEDIERLLKIPIRRISAYDIEKHKKELIELTSDLKQVKYSVKNILTYTITYLEHLLDKYGKNFSRKTEIRSFATIREREIAKRNFSFMYDKKTGYMGSKISSGKKVADVSSFDKILLFRESGIWMVVNVMEKQFIGKDVILMGVIDKEKLIKTKFTSVFTTKDDYIYIKRFKIEKFSVNKAYEFIPKGAKNHLFTTKDYGDIVLHYDPMPRLRKLEERFTISNYLVKGAASKGVRISTKKTKKILLDVCTKK